MRCRCVLIPVEFPSDAEASLAPVLDRLRNRLAMLPTGEAQRESIEAERDRVVCEYLAEYRKLCREAGPYAYATDLGLDPDASTFREIAYMAAWRDMASDCTFLEEAIGAAESGFVDWLVGV